MIKFIGKKNISHSRIRELLSLSELTNDYTNNGPVKKMLEEKLEEVLDLKDKMVLCFSNGTTALHGLMFLCNRKYNTHKWVTPAFTFPSAVVGNIFDVDILDINSETATLPMDADLLAPYDGIILTNLFGSYVDLEAWEKFCHKHNKILIFDNASSPLSKCEGINICNFGDYSFGSFHHTKYLGFGEGGFAVVPQEDYKILSQITNFGYDKNKIYNRLSSNFKMSDVSAAYILSQVEKYDILRHCEIQEEFVNNVTTSENCELFNYKKGVVYGNVPVSVTKEVLSKMASISREFSVEILKYYRPLKPFSNSVNLYNNIFNFPLYGCLSNLEIGKINNLIKGI